MLAACLVTADDPKCPFCRTVVGTARHGSSSDDDGDSDDEAFMEMVHLPDPDLPQWRRVSCGPHLYSCQRRRLSGVAQQLLAKSRNHRAPPALKRYGSAVAAAKRRVASEDEALQRFLRQRRRSTGAAAMASHAAHLQRLSLAKRKLFAAQRSLVLRSRRSKTCSRYLAEHPPREV